MSVSSARPSVSAGDDARATMALAPVAYERRASRAAADQHVAPFAISRDATFRRALLAADLVCLSVVGAVSLGAGSLRPAMAMAVLGFVLAAKTIGLYDRDEAVLCKRTLDEAPKLFHLATLGALVIWLAQSAVTTATVGQTQVVGFWAALFVGLLLSRTAARQLAQSVAPVERCLVIGDDTDHGRLREKLEQDRHLKARVVAHLPLIDRRLAGDGRGPDAALERVIAAERIHRVIVAPTGADTPRTLDVISRAKALGMNVSVVPQVCDVVGSAVEFDQVGGMTLLGVRPLRLSRSSAIIKRVVDIAGALVGLTVAAPIMIAAAIAIRMGSPGPVLFRQTRVGRGGKHFEILKFRTMHMDADSARTELEEHSNGDGLFKVPDDPRVTRIGRVLRRSSLDELPQLFNVLRGDMSLVGPRPLILEEDRRVVGFHRRRLQLKPGLTGPWQILGSAQARVGMSEMVTLDYLYTAHWSLWADVEILLRTVAYVLGARGV